ncbi:unnamed protein product [Meloidogyne enterolobii]|uniref:Uncharacterized protein n=1 Tax=Meloidogyne enterolobii TaxID=390850 RepID=A0ACB0YC91_MELEN
MPIECRLRNTDFMSESRYRSTSIMTYTLFLLMKWPAIPFFSAAKGPLYCRRSFILRGLIYFPYLPSQFFGKYVKIGQSYTPRSVSNDTNEN